jgi:hypothetical protein
MSLLILLFKSSDSKESVMDWLYQSNQNGHHLSAAIKANRWALREGGWVGTLLSAKTSWSS